MIKVENIDTWGFKHAIRGMRNPLNSWDKSDSYFEDDIDVNSKAFSVGEKDLDLMHRLYQAGTEHRKYLRHLFVSMDITAPLYWWKEFDTYKFVLPDPEHVDTNSCSTMHKIHAKEFEPDDFSIEHLYGDVLVLFEDNIIETLNLYRKAYINTKDKRYWWQLIQLLPSSYNQRRTLATTYENVFAIIHQRSGHKLDEWNQFVDILKNNVPYVKEIMRLEE